MEIFIVFIIVGACGVYIGRKFYKSMTVDPSSGGCSGGCASCAMHASGCEMPRYNEKKDL
jgi:hypothetical protein